MAKFKYKDTSLRDGTPHWYIIHSHTGHEDVVADTLKQRITNLGMANKIFDVIVPKEKQIEIKNGKRKTIDKKIFPGYILINMIVEDDSWYVVRNTPNVTGFVGTGVDPTPISEAEIQTIQKRMGVDDPKYVVEFVEGDLVSINDGPFKDFDGTISEFDNEKGKLIVMVNMFGRETPVELDSLQVVKL